MAADYRQKTREVLDFVARKVDENIIKKYKPELWSLYSTGTAGTKEEHSKSDIDIQLIIDKKTLDKYEEKGLGRRCAELQRDAWYLLNKEAEEDEIRDLTVWIQEIEDFNIARTFRLYARNAILTYGTNEEKRAVKPSDLPSPITNKSVLARWVNGQSVFLGGNVETFEKVRRDPTLYEPVRWEGYEMAVRGMRDLVLGLSNLESVKVSKSVLRLADAICISLGRPSSTYEETLEVSHGILAEYEDYERLVFEAGKIREEWKSSEREIEYDFNDSHFKKTLLDFAEFCRSETKKVAYREGYFMVPERMACLNFYINTSMRSLAREIFKTSISKEFSSLFAGEVVDLLLRRRRMMDDKAFNPSFAAPYKTDLDTKTAIAVPPFWIERLNKIGVPPILDANEIEDLKQWLRKITVADAGLQGKIFLATAENASEKAKAARKLDEAIKNRKAKNVDKCLFSYTTSDEYLLAELYVCRGDAASNDEEAVQFYKMSLKEDVYQPYVWLRLANALNLPNYKTIAKVVGRCMQAGRPWAAYAYLYLQPGVLDEEATEIWESAYQKKVERFEEYVNRLERFANEYKNMPLDDEGLENEGCRNFVLAARNSRDAIIEYRTEAAKAISEFLKSGYHPLSAAILGRFDPDYNVPSMRFLEKAEMSRRRVRRDYLAGLE